MIPGLTEKIFTVGFELTSMLLIKKGGLFDQYNRVDKGKGRVCRIIYREIQSQYTQCIKREGMYRVLSDRRCRIRNSDTK